MPHPKQNEQLAALPKETAKTLEKVLDAAKPSPKKRNEAFVRALQESQFPHYPVTLPGKLTDLNERRERGLMPLPSELTPTQRALAELLAYEEEAQLYFLENDNFRLFSLPETAANRRRWLGIDPPGLLDETMSYERNGEKRVVPRWYALQAAMFRDRWLKDFFSSLPIGERLALLGATYPAAYGLGSVLEMMDHFIDPQSIDGSCGAWAVRTAERLCAIAPDEYEAGPHLRLLVFLALARAKVSIEERWEPLFPLLGRPHRHAPMREALAAIAPERHEATILSAMPQKIFFNTFAGVIALLDNVPSEKIATELFQRITEAPARTQLVEQLETLGTRHPVLLETAQKLRAKLKPKTKRS